jgi:O-succinylhomoserine sulfhydrylase
MDEFQFESMAIRAQLERTQYKEHSAPIFPTSSFVFDTAEEARDLFAGQTEGNIYSRYSNPNTDEFINKLALLEKMETGIPTASGMAAMFCSIAAFVKAGDHIVASRSVFGSTHQILTQLLPRWGVTCTYVNINEPETWEKAIQPNTKMFFGETPSNPGLDIMNLKEMGQLCKAHGIIMNIDNCFATPYVQNPADFGADIVTHSATKFIDGQGRVLGGAILGSKELIDQVMFVSRHTGPAMSPFHAWILSKSLETLHVRMERHCENALALATFLSENKKVKWVKYPHLASHAGYELAKEQMRMGGGLVTFELATGAKDVFATMNKLKMLKISANLGDTRSIITHPASTTHSKLSGDERQAVGISDGLMRVSVGLEHIDDIIKDIEQAIG